MFLIFYTGKHLEFISMARSMENAKKKIRECRIYERTNYIDSFQIGVLEVDSTMNYLTHGKDGPILFNGKHWDYLDHGNNK